MLGLLSRAKCSRASLPCCAAAGVVLCAVLVACAGAAQLRRWCRSWSELLRRSCWSHCGGAAGGATAAAETVLVREGSLLALPSGGENSVVGTSRYCWNYCYFRRLHQRLRPTLRLKLLYCCTLVV